jgi:hypothetical protein
LEGEFRSGSCRHRNYCGEIDEFEILINDHVEQVDPEREREKEIAKKQKK